MDHIVIKFFPETQSADVLTPRKLFFAGFASMGIKIFTDKPGQYRLHVEGDDVEKSVALISRCATTLRLPVTYAP